MKKTINSLFSILITLVVIASSLSAQSVTKVLISGLGGQHDLDVQTAFEQGYASYNGATFSGTITQYYDAGTSSSFQYASDNGYQMIVRSTTGLGSAIVTAASYPAIQLVMPAGSNSYVYVFSGDIETCPVIVTGAGVDNNATGYKVEFFAPDPITGTNLSSFSNGYIAGELAYLANSLSKTIQEARVIARESIRGDSGPTLFDGFGKINIQSAIDYALPVELSSFNAAFDGNNIVLKWATATEINNAGFEIERKSGSVESSSWEKVAFVKGFGNSNSPKEYSYVDKSASNGKYLYRLKQVDNDGTFKYYDPVEVEALAVSELALKQNYPNPFNPATVIKYQIPSEGHVTLKVFDMLGREVQTVVNETEEAGTHEVHFDGSKLSSGIYFYTLESAGLTQTRKMILMK